jgi:hypothetical protein
MSNFGRNFWMRMKWVFVSVVCKKINERQHTAVIVTNLRILTWHLYVIEFAVMEFSKVVTDEIERLPLRSEVKILLILCPPLLKPPNILYVSGFAFHKVLKLILSTFSNRDDEDIG